MIYDISGGMTPIKTSDKNDLKPGQIVQLEGYTNPRYCIIKNEGINTAFQDYGSRYIMVDVEKYRQQIINAHQLKWIEDKKDGRIQYYIMTGETLPTDAIIDLWQKAQKRKAAETAVHETQERVKNENITKGKALAAELIPQSAKAVIVARFMVDDSDSQTDYFASHSERVIVLAYSKTTRDNFREMRKAAARFEHTKQYTTPPTTDQNGTPQTAENKSWWRPFDEHREKYSMGRGYYLGGDRGKYSGWIVEKEMKRTNGWDDNILIALACGSHTLKPY